MSDGTQQGRCQASPSLACSRLSDTPESIAAAQKLLTPQHDGYSHTVILAVPLDTAKKLERERDAARATVKQVYDSLKEDCARLSHDLHSLQRQVRVLDRAKGRYNTEEAYRRLIALLPENTKDDSPA